MADAAIAVAALWRLTSLLVYERGPWEVFPRLRRAVGIVDTYDAFTGEMLRREIGAGQLAKALSCLWCMSMWLAVPVLAAAYWLPWWVLAPLALSTGAIVFDRVITGSSKDGAQ